MVANTSTVVLDMSSAERSKQQEYWFQHTADQLTVEAMMLDSQAAIIDRLERPEVRTVAHWRLLTASVHVASMTASWLPHLVSTSM